MSDCFELLFLIVEKGLVTGVSNVQGLRHYLRSGHACEKLPWEFTEAVKNLDLLKINSSEMSPIFARLSLDNTEKNVDARQN